MYYYRPKSDLRACDTPLKQFVGIDIAKASFTACVCIYTYGDMAFFSDVASFKNTKTGFNQLMKWTRKEALKTLPVGFLMESTGVYYEELAAYLKRLEQHVFVVLPNKARSFTEYQYIRSKNDAMDSRVLALMGCMDRKLKEWEQPDPFYAELRAMTRFDSQALDIRAVITNHLEALSSSNQPNSSVVRQYKLLLDSLNRRIEDNQNKEVELVCSRPEVKEKIDKLLTIKGFGFATIVRILAETSGFKDFANAKQLTSYVGVDVVENQSGPIAHKTKISKRGNAYIRAALYYPALSASRYNPHLREQYQRILEKHPSEKKIGIVALERKMLLLMYSMWKSGELYDPNKYADKTAK